MIRIRRGAEPPELGLVRQRELPRVRGIAAVRRPTSKEIGDEYAVVVQHLFDLQRGKCCYCERQLDEPSYNDVEHYRPKAGAQRAPGSAEDHGYWWLAWSWDNLLFACPPYNRSHKRDRFPLAQGSAALQPEEEPPGNEQPLLIDPGGEDPLADIEFYEEALPQRRRWLPRGRAGSHRGGETIRVLRLERPALIDAYTRHVQVNILPHLGRIRAQLMLKNRALLESYWAEAKATLLHPDAPFRALAYDVLDQAVPIHIRREYGLPLEHPQVGA
jgi:uncharacterized protein (TIGR02646 family)